MTIVRKFVSKLGHNNNTAPVQGILAEVDKIAVKPFDCWLFSVELIDKLAAYYNIVWF